MVLEIQCCYDWHMLVLYIHHAFPFAHSDATATFKSKAQVISRSTHKTLVLDSIVLAAIPS